MKKSIFRTLTILTVSSLSILGCSSNSTPTAGTDSKAKQEVITLKLADNFPVGHAAYDATKDVFIPALEEGGKIKVEYYPNGQLGDIKDMITLAQNGSVDIGYTSSGLVTGQIPVSSVFGIPGEFNSATEAHLTFKKLVFEGPLKEEFKKVGLQPVSISATDPYEVFTSKKAVRVPADIKGLKLRGVGGDADKILNEIGATTVETSSSEIYESISKGVTDGTFFSYANAPTLNLQEVVKYSTNGIHLGTPSLFHFMNQERFNNLSPEIQQIILKAGEKLGAAIAKNYDERAAKNVSTFTAKGVTINQLSEAEQKQWNEALKSAPDVWLKSMKTRKADGAENVYQKMIEYRDQIRKK